jgi:hypothetical protein
VSANPFMQGLLMQQRAQKSDRHHRAGRLGGEQTARLYPGQHARWGALKGQSHTKEETASPTQIARRR